MKNLAPLLLDCRVWKKNVLDNTMNRIALHTDHPRCRPHNLLSNSASLQHPPPPDVRTASASTPSLFCILANRHLRLLCLLANLLPNMHVDPDKNSVSGETWLKNDTARYS